MKISRKTTLFSLSSVLALTVASWAPPAQAALFGVSEQEEIQAGQQSRAEAIKEYGQPLSSSDPRQIRVTRIGALFARQAQRKTIPYSYTVLQNDKVLNAFAAPGGPIFVTTKLISTAGNDAELAYVLGHETGHIENKHIVKSVEKQQKVGLGVGILGAILGGSRGGNIVGSIASVGYTLWSRGYSRDQESDADTYGVRAMSRLGFDPRAAVSMLGKLDSGGGGGLDKYLSTHPQPKDRQQRVSAQIQSENLVQVAQNAGGARLWASGNADGNIYGTYQTVSNDEFNVGTQANGEINLGYPLEIVTRSGSRVVMVPVRLFARWAGGDAPVQGTTHIAQRGNSYITFREGSDVATLNGRQVRLSAPAQSLNGRLYAPLGSVAAGLGGSANYDGSANVVRVQFDGGRSGYFRLS